MASNWKLTLPSGAVLYASNVENAPSPNYIREHIVEEFFSEKSHLTLQEKEDLLIHLSGEVIRNAPSKFVGFLLSNLICCFWLEGGVRQLLALKSMNEQAICGAVFKVGEVVWTCRQCAKDATCVQCNACFKNSDHEGHEVYFHRGSWLYSYACGAQRRIFKNFFLTS